MIRSGVIFFIALIAACAAIFVIWKYFHLPELNEVGAVLITGTLAVIVAVWAIFSQRAITRRQCTLEHIARLEADGDLIKGRVTFRELTKSPGGLKAWAVAEKDQTPEFQAIVTRLNEFELVAIGIQRGIIDLELYSRWFKAGTIRAWKDSEEFIDALRTRHDNDLIFHEFEELARWFENRERPLRRNWWVGKLF